MNEGLKGTMSSRLPVVEKFLFREVEDSCNSVVEEETSDISARGRYKWTAFKGPPYTCSGQTWLVTALASPSIIWSCIASSFCGVSAFRVTARGSFSTKVVDLTSPDESRSESLGLWASFLKACLGIGVSLDSETASSLNAEKGPYEFASSEREASSTSLMADSISASVKRASEHTKTYQPVALSFDK